MLVNFAATTRLQNSLDMWFFDFWYRHVCIFLTRCSARISRITAWTIYFLQWRSGKARVRVDRGVQAKFEAGWHRLLIGPSKKSDAVCMSIGDQDTSRSQAYNNLDSRLGGCIHSRDHRHSHHNKQSLALRTPSLHKFRHR